MTFISLRSRGDNGFGETFVLLHAVGQFHTAEFATAVLILSPGTSRENRTDNHLHTEALTLQSDGHHGIWSSKFPVRTDVSGGIQELGGDLVQHLSLERDTLGQYYVERRNTVCSHHHHQVVVDVIYITHFTVINTLLSLKLELCLC